ncbi:MAG: Smr/MutS family protein [Myxococcota bacterium]|nr:Smr/MutS family protein [Myxococcota bacterium]
MGTDNRNNDRVDGKAKDAGVDAWEGDVVELPIDGVLDLHGFQPKEVKDLVADYIDACVERDIVEVRIIHGKGTGVLRRIVHSALQRHPSVKNFRLAGHGSGSWGATLVDLQPRTTPSP